MADHVEIEQKFDVEAGFTLPDLAAVPGCAAISAPETYHLSATYYDTAGNRLAASKITLRRRTGGTDEGWHLKLPSTMVAAGGAPAASAVTTTTADADGAGGVRHARSRACRWSHGRHSNVFISAS